MQWFAQAPANIALIKYMGKQDDRYNIPNNPSLSYTLNDLLSDVMLEKNPGKKDLWEPLQIPGTEPVILHENAKQRFLDHLQRIKDYFQYDGGFIVRSTNNFPMSSGLASSASSFAALTICAIRAICELTQKPIPSIEEQALLSAKGSGSSCRSFVSPWALWDNQGIQAIELPYPHLLHEVILIHHEPKKVSSSEAHQRVKTSPLYEGRAERAKDNLKQLLDAFRTSNWACIRQISMRDFLDMHQLFETAEKPFSYMHPKTKTLLHRLEKEYDKIGDGPIVTMDAGPNIHLLYRPDQTLLKETFKQTVLVGNYDFL